MDPMLDKAKCVIFHTPCAHLPCKNILDKQWMTFTPDAYQKIYFCVDRCLYALICISFNDWKIVIFEILYRNEEAFYGIHKAILDVISSHMRYVVTHGNFGAVMYQLYQIVWLLYCKVYFWPWYYSRRCYY